MRTQLLYSRLLLSALMLGGLLSGCSDEEDSAPAVTSGAQAQAEAHPVHWSYEGDTSPQHWGELEEDFKTCELGKEQSPINIKPSEATINKKLHPVEVKYSPSEVSLVNNGHTVQVSVKGTGNTLTLEGKTYTLKQFHFHLPSEHEVDGKHAEMELHFVHQSEDGKLAVLGVLIKGGAENKELNKLWSRLPQKESKDPTVIDGTFDLKALLPADLHSYRYHGSLTTPPCSEGVQWTVLQQPITWSEEQIGAFRHLFPHDNRPVQPLESRTLEKEG
ncbi:carbonic anhydrase family protein [Paenibacillus spiritus]|uniref:carbonic anhydrase n=1 Tax=Paenibacillus spiritus TaxID=2496557 RepID=A0A5J5FWP7_9BACL|nr:carbonic anhydrase family protein [Paenibacillus spiritus]KAA8998362.1 carbonic anhydrase family protein [Paenibacillus spiritus]